MCTDKELNQTKPKRDKNSEYYNMLSSSGRFVSGKKTKRFINIIVQLEPREQNLTRTFYFHDKSFKKEFFTRSFSFLFFT